MRWLNALTCFLAAWVCGFIAFGLGADQVLGIGGVLLLSAALLFAIRPEDPLRRAFDALPDRLPWSNVPRGRPRHVLGATILALIGVAWVVGGIVGLN